jgi:hypothetical protein
MGDFVRLLVDLSLQLARVARVLTTRPSFTKRLALVLKAVSGLVEPASPTYLTERMLVSPCVCLPVRKPWCTRKQAMGCRRCSCECAVVCSGVHVHGRPVPHFPPPLV